MKKHLDNLTPAQAQASRLESPPARAGKRKEGVPEHSAVAAAQRNTEPLSSIVSWLRCLCLTSMVIPRPHSLQCQCSTRAAWA
jgi:hypothetical protein